MGPLAIKVTAHLPSARSNGNGGLAPGHILHARGEGQEMRTNANVNANVNAKAPPVPIGHPRNRIAPAPAHVTPVQPMQPSAATAIGRRDSGGLGHTPIGTAAAGIDRESDAKGQWRPNPAAHYGAASLSLRGQTAAAAPQRGLVNRDHMHMRTGPWPAEALTKEDRGSNVYSMENRDQPSARKGRPARTSRTSHPGRQSGPGVNG